MLEISLIFSKGLFLLIDCVVRGWVTPPNAVMQTNPYLENYVFVMIDTVRLCGYGRFYNFKKTFERFVGFNRSDGTEYVIEQEVEKVPGKYVARYSPSEDIMRVEFNIGKLIFENYNVYNYEKNPAVLLALLQKFGQYFFGNNPFYVARIDIGGVCTYPNTDTATNTLNRMRSARPPGARINKFKHQNYSDSVFYYSKNWSIKIYNKGIELKESKELPSFSAFDLHSTLRFEKTYRFNELNRLGRPFGRNKVTPNMGILFKDFDLRLVMDDFFQVFQDWDFVASGTIEKDSGLRGVVALLGALDAKGALSEVEAAGVVSQSSMYRYRKSKLGKPDFVPTISFDYNLEKKFLHKFQYCYTFGVTELFNS